MSISNNSRLGLVHYNGEYEEKGKLVGGFGDLSISAENSSPYANGQMITLEVGSEATRFLVHDKVLSRSEVLAAKYRPRTFAGKSVRLPELDQTTAHTLIDYLYTGRYQTLSTLASSDTVIPEGYTLSGCVYCAAVRYDLPGLATLARNKIRSFNISIFDVLSVARDHTFPLLPEWDTWYQTYVEEALNRAMAEDPEPFRKPDFISMVEGNGKLLRLVWETVLSNYARISAPSVAGEDRATTPTPGLVSELAPSTTCSIEESVPVERPVAVEESVPVPIPMDGIVETAVVTANVFTEFKEEESLQMEEIEPTAEFPPTPEPFTDELGFGSSKTYQKMCKRSDQLGADGVSPTEPEASAHVRFDSVMQVEQKAIKPVVEANVVAGASVAGDSPRQVPIEGREAFPIPKKSKKAKKSKKLPKAPIEVESST
ncbi:hypothetical protein PtrV1_02803 [Pyrenophora tritici-repentis]|uniref:Uncharacterized protein n=1 Tax=Pyrenophora tritici-repentis TaxID=45151 RepID=A0A2W1GTN3_9PLEO|nr:hypothetical protein PtrV1_02803 [Pyrenophora tritici-repentis]KAF7455555.1 hypothetical protein A1F99_028130 [Pyrenophora tritici-repentis]KAF7578760.1 hypothetical protein PtrM4_030000 [Pyrenophora tritici-repentis]KAI0588733.1 hypothetical protein Alg215_00660 [Pyrenophora tritici-repentis]KAI1588380.1 hypothetical protein PtrEW7m1_000618 [Pyrenophora tritici-repentis]